MQSKGLDFLHPIWAMIYSNEEVWTGDEWINGIKNRVWELVGKTIGQSAGLVFAVGNLHALIIYPSRIAINLRMFSFWLRVGPWLGRGLGLGFVFVVSVFLLFCLSFAVFRAPCQYH